jgi:hypothetical protein
MNFVGLTTEPVKVTSVYATWLVTVFWNLRGNTKADEYSTGGNLVADVDLGAQRWVLISGKGPGLDCIGE